jgi:hypothetical protein
MEKHNIFFAIVSYLSFYLSRFYIQDTVRRFQRMEYYREELDYVSMYGYITDNTFLGVLSLLSLPLLYFPISLILDWNWFLVLLLSIASWFFTDVCIFSLTNLFLLVYKANTIYSPRKVIVLWFVYVALGFIFYAIAYL